MNQWADIINVAGKQGGRPDNPVITNGSHGRELDIQGGKTK